MTNNEESDLLELRQRAESILNKVEVGAAEISPAEIKALIHDLRVHQIELEIQNEELRLAQTELAKVRDRYADLYQQAPVGYITLNAVGIITQFNNTFAELVGRGASALLNKPFLEIIHPKDREVFLARFRAFFKNPQEKTLDLTLPHGSEAWFQARLEARPQLRSINGTDSSGAHEALLLAVSDVSEQMRAQAALVDSERRFRALFEAGADAIIVRNVQGRITEVNQVACSRLGYSRRELMSMEMAQLEPPHLAAQIPARMERLLKQGEILFETIHLTKDGEEISTELSCRVFELGEEKFILSIARDITDRVRLQEERDGLQAQLLQSQKMEAIGTLAGGIAHDFNNILAAVMGFTEIASDTAAAGGDNQNELRQIMKAAERAKDLVQQLLTFSRKMEMELKPLDINQAVTNQVQIIEQTFPKNIVVEAELGASLNVIHGNRNQLEQVVLNLATNARDAMPQGGRLLIRTDNMDLPQLPHGAPVEAEPGSYVILTVSDDGQGMDDGLLDKIFDPFFTTKEVGKGTGLGLSTVYGIVRGHRGFVLCNSRPGQGSSFQVYLPAQSHQALSELCAPEVGSRHLGGSETLLVIDDEEALLAIAGRILQAAGYRVLSAKSGEEGLQVFNRNRGEIALVVSDLNMPGMGGFQCIRKMMEADPATKVIASSGLPMSGQTKEIQSCGAQGFVGKPYRRNDLLTEVRRLLDQS